jgi:hypothetical protein
LKLIQKLVEHRSGDNSPPPRDLVTQAGVSGNDFA